MKAILIALGLTLSYFFTISFNILAWDDEGCSPGIK